MHQTMCAYGRSSAVTAPWAEQTFSPAAPYPDIEWRGVTFGRYPLPDAAVAKLIEFEIIGRFCFAIRMLLKKEFLIDVNWHYEHEPESFVPAWAVMEKADQMLMATRPRATWRTVEHLLRRYEKRVLASKQIR